MPSAPFNVYYHDEEVFCTVRISHNQPVFADILQAFNEANGVCKIPAARTLFYAPRGLRVSPHETLPSRVFQWLDEDDRQQQWSWQETDIPEELHNVCQAGIPPREKVVHVIVVVKPIEGSFPLQPPVKKLKEDLRAIEAALQASDGFSPSAGARTDSNMSKVTETGFYVYGRPLLNYGPSVAIYNKTLGKLVQELGSLHVPSRERNAILADCLDLMDIACDFHPSEAIRQGRLEKTVESLLPGDVKWSVSSSRPTAGARWTVGVNEALLPYCLLELKNGHVGGDGRFQNMLTYKAYIKMLSHKFHNHTHFPVVLLSMTCERLDVDIVVFTDAVYRDHLLTLDLGIKFNDKDGSVQRLVQTVCALRRCLDGLRGHYRSLMVNATPSNLAYFFPDPTADPVDDPTEYDPLPELSYISKLDWSGREGLRLDSATRRGGALFLAKLGDRSVLVKFTDRYNAKAHRLLANRKLAPHLHAFVRVVGGFMVVMDYVAPTQGRALSESKRPFPEEVKVAVRSALDVLHEDRIVFGDLRPQNVLQLVPAQEGEPAAWLVDFDWAGEAGRAEYPLLMNLKVVWAEGMSRGELMEVEHDEGMFANMFP